MFLNSEMHSRTISPDRKPFYGDYQNKDSFGISYGMIIVAFGNQAKGFQWLRRPALSKVE